jgi:hypothetical protein
MEISPDKKEVFQKMITGETPVVVCVAWGMQGVPSVEKECALCSQKLALDAKNQDKLAEIKAVCICAVCLKAIQRVNYETIYKSMIGGVVRDLVPFTVAEETECFDGLCPCIHWKCPFCPGVGSFDPTDYPMPEYFSSVCESTRQIFLVHRKQDVKKEMVN